MSMKIKVSYETEEEEKTILALFKPIMDSFKIKKSKGTPPYKHLFFNTKKREKAHK